MDYTRRYAIILIMAVMPAVVAHGVTIKPSNPHYGVTNIVPPSETIDFAVTIADDMGYVLKSSGFSTVSSSDAFVWKTNGACSGRQFSFFIVNTEWIEETAVASVNCVWRKATGDGGGGDGTTWPDIDGSALDMAVAGKGSYNVEADTNRAPAGASVGVKAVLEDGKGGTKAANSDWTVAGAGEADGQDHGVSEIQVTGTNTGIATATGTFCMDGTMTDSDTITFVGVASVTCLGVTSTTNDPGTKETVYAQYMGTGQTFTVTAAADPDEPWPEGNPAWTGATPPDSNNPAMATNYISEPGQYLVRAYCGTSSKALKIELTEVLLSMAEYLGIDLTDPTNKVNSGEASASVTPSGGVTNYSWTLTGVAVFTNGVQATNTAASSISVYEARTASGAYRGDSITVQITPLGYAVQTNFTVVKADIAWPGLAETNEETIGGLVAYNGDDDDTNGVVDATQGAMENGVEDDDLLAIILKLDPGGLPTNETVTISCDGCWLDRQKLTNAAGEYKLTNASLFPLTVYVEGNMVSQAARDRTISMTHGASGARDLVKYTILKVELTEAKGLYTSNGTYQVGYTSTDNVGRVYCNSAYDPATPSSNSWSENKQYVDFTVQVIPTNAVLPSDARIVWEAEDADDPSNEGADVNNAAKEVLDPNDYDSVDNDGDGTADNSDGDDNTGGRDGASEWEEISADYALTSNETKIKDGISKVRFNVTDDGGDNFIVKAKLKLSAGATPCDGDQTGVMTVWKKLNIESVTMTTADALPVNDLPARFTQAFVEFHIALSRSVSDGIVNNGTPPTNQWVMGLTEGAAGAACQDYVTAASGEFSQEGPGWFFVASAHEFIPLTSLTSEVLYPPSGTASNATANGTTITLPIAIATGKVPDIVYIYNAALSSNVMFEVKSGTLSGDRKTFEIEKKDYHEIDSPYTSFLDADLTDYGFSTGSTINVRVKSPGSYGVGGISPGLAGKTIVFTGWVSASNSLGTLVHELTHAFGLAHKCGNWDFKTTTPSTSCTMNYGTWFILDDGTPRAPAPWTDKRTAPNLCAPHIKAIRESNLEDLPGLGW